MKLTLILLAFLLAFLLSACTPGTLTPAVSLAQQQADISGNVAATATAMLVENRHATSTAWSQSAEGTAIKLGLLRSEAQATQSAISTTVANNSRSMSATGTAVVTEQAIIAQWTEQAGELESIEHSNTVRLIVTQAAQKEADVSRYSDLWFNALCGGLSLLGVIAFMLTAFLASRLAPPVITALGENASRKDISRGIRESLNGNGGHQVVLTNVPTTNGLPVLDVKLARNRTTTDKAVIEHSHLTGDNADVLRGLERMAELVGGHSEQLPSTSKRIESQLYNEVYQPIINALNKSNDVGSREGKSGLFVNSLKWKDLDDLMAGIVDGRVDVTGRVMWNGNKRPA